VECILHVGAAASGHRQSPHSDYIIYNIYIYVYMYIYIYIDIYVTYSVISCVSLLAVAIAAKEEETTVSFTIDPQTFLTSREICEYYCAMSTQRKQQQLSSHFSAAEKIP